MLQDPEAKARGLIFRQMWNASTHFTRQSITGESYRHHGSVARTLSDDASFSAPPPAPAQREAQHRHYPASARSAGDGRVRRWFTSSRKQRVCDICSKSILKPFSDFFFFIVIYKNCFFPSRIAGKIQHAVTFLRRFLFLSTQTTFQAWTDDSAAK